MSDSATGDSQGAELDALRRDILDAVEAAADLDALERVRVDALGKKGRITARMKQLGQLPAEERKAAGQRLNAIKDEVASAIEARRAVLEEQALDARLAREQVDISLPPRPQAGGRIHPISQAVEELITIFADMGYRVAEGPEVETDWYNFTALNIPPDHPARQMQDTFYLPERDDGAEMVLRTHTSPGQIRTMQNQGPPIRVVVPGRTYRCDYDQTHTPMFHQLEGLVVDEATHMGHLKGCLLDFCRAFFNVDEPPLRFRPSFFPFTEPSAEVDIGCQHSGDEIRIGHGSDDWLEILGCGMVHPNVLSNAGIDPNRYQGFAFGMGIERLAMLKYGVPDLRSFFEGDVRWLRHYGFSVLERPNLAFGL